MNKKKIWISDLTHTAQGISANTFPLGASYVAAYTKKELNEFFEENIGFFTKSSRLRIQQLYFSDEGTENSSFEDANRAYDLLISGSSFVEVYNLGSDSAIKIPNSLMTLSKVREYIGPSLMNLARNLQPGTFSQPIKVHRGHKIIFLFGG